MRRSQLRLRETFFSAQKYWGLQSFARMICLSNRTKYISSFIRKAKPVDVANFFNNVESIWDHLIKKNKCFKLDSKIEFVAEAGAADKV